jgi:predicted adenylyl cyclase CyaB
MEVEIRTLVDKDIFGKLVSLKAQRMSEISQTDSYWANTAMFKDLGYTFLMRIRADSRGRVKLSYKGAKLKTDGVWEEYELTIDNPQEAEKMLSDMGFENFLVLRKKRVTFGLRNFQIEIDDFENFGMVMEVETKCEPQEALLAKSEMRRFLVSIGVRDEDIIEKGSLALILQKMDSPYKEYFKN